MARHREEVINICLAECLRDNGLSAQGEQLESARPNRVMPDILVDLLGLRCIVEGKFSDSPQALAEVSKNASERVRDGIAHVGVGVVYPATLRTVPQQELKSALLGATLGFCVCIETNYSVPEWHEGGAQGLIDLLKRNHEELLRDDILARSIEQLRYGMEGLVNTITAHPGVAIRVAGMIGVNFADDEQSTESDSD